MAQQERGHTLPEEGQDQQHQQVDVQSLQDQQGEGQIIPDKEGEGQIIPDKEGEGQNQQDQEGGGQNLQNQEGGGQIIQDQEGEGQIIQDQEGQIIHDEQGEEQHQQGGHNQPAAGQPQQNHQAEGTDHFLRYMSGRIVLFGVSTSLQFPNLMFSIRVTYRRWLEDLNDRGLFSDPSSIPGPKKPPSTLSEWKLEQQWKIILNDYLSVEYRLYNMWMIPEERQFSTVNDMIADMDNMLIEMDLLLSNHPILDAVVDYCRGYLCGAKAELFRVVALLMSN